MTFHDEVFAATESASRKACINLLMYVQTISPVSSKCERAMCETLLQFADEMGWHTRKDEQGIWELVP